MKQDFVKKIPVLIPTANKAIHGATIHAAVLKVLQNTPENIAFDLNGVITSRDNYELAKVSLTVTRNTFLLKTQMTRETIRIARDIIKQFLGTEYNQNWDITGLNNGSIALPYTAEELLPIALGFKAYFVAHPERENVPLNVTSANLQVLYDDLVAAQNAVASKEETLEELQSVRDGKVDRLYKRLRSMVEELNLLMGPLDPRWKTFGFNMPGADETPEAPTHLQAILIGPTAAALKWDASPRAEYYRVWMKVHGAEGEYLSMGSPADLDFTLENLPANSTVDIVVTALNNGGESDYSQVITLTTHA